MSGRATDMQVARFRNETRSLSLMPALRVNSGTANKKTALKAVSLATDRADQAM
jgi:hypothetical protein